jgi:anti-sigma B factor antagonist
MLDVKRVYSDNVATIFLSGEFDMSNSYRARDAILEILRDTDMDLLIDLEEVKYIDSSAVATLIEGYKACKEKGAAYALAHTTDRVEKVLKLTRLDHFFTIYPDRETAYQALETADGGSGRE